MKILDLGGNDGIRSRTAYPKADILVLDKKTGFDITTIPLPQGNWDIVLANHIIEHLMDIDDFLDKCYEVMNEDTVLEISTPNLAAWFNRLLFMLGYLPHSYELSFKHNVGKIDQWGDERLGGHLRIFTPTALMQLLEKHGFKILNIKGEHTLYEEMEMVGSQSPNIYIKALDIMLTLNPNLASAFRIKCKKCLS